MKADLHCHSYFSDGQHPPQLLVDLAVRNDITHLAITDHDCMLDCSDLRVPPELNLVPGLEISANWNNTEVHVVGLCVTLDQKACKIL